ncbi:MAG: hypothetical protein ABIJ95_06710 [Pseudomonadota bacterium]
MSKFPSTCPMGRDDILDRYFMEHRARLLDVAAFLDRLDRAMDGARPEDFRLAAFRKALAALSDGKGERARRILTLLSDPTTEPIASAAGMKGAHGACPLSCPEEDLP